MVMLRGQKVSLQTAVNKFFSAFGAVWRVVTASAYRQARQKVQPEVFVHLNAVACEEYYACYGAEDEVVLWQGHRVLGMDGSYLNLPCPISSTSPLLTTHPTREAQSVLNFILHCEHSAHHPLVQT